MPLSAGKRKWLHLYNHVLLLLDLLNIVVFHVVHQIADQIHLYIFKMPKDPALKKQWIVKIRRDEGPHFNVSLDRFSHLLLLLRN